MCHNLHVLVVHHILGYAARGHQFLCVLIRDLHKQLKLVEALKVQIFTHLKTKFILNGHDHFHMVEAVKSEVL